MRIFEDKKIRLIESNVYVQPFDAFIANTDILSFLQTIPDETVGLVVSSPPYNIGKSYESRTLFKDYLGFQKTVIKECYRILKPSGNFLLADWKLCG